ncbi:hypothetical protein BDQ12DRAFT_691513 [Crucibulum laeve]|uniref:Uncharacterized protein n=1 Tax=Crucibulum laeve TaxID=68775 RepID=A0A5C3LWP7_9AGAR|nr:hypothetical protein BDQ12DRAFT_691513 [Crucibulum laeve]
MALRVLALLVLVVGTGVEVAMRTLAALALKVQGIPHLSLSWSIHPLCIFALCLYSNVHVHSRHSWQCL